MPYQTTAPDWRSRSHPLNDLLHTLAGTGGQPTKAELAALPDSAEIRHGVRQAARKIDSLRQAGEFQAAREHADETLGRLGPIAAGLDLPEPEPTPEPTSVDEIAARMFHA